jgi:hypothetical protein
MLIKYSTKNCISKIILMTILKGCLYLGYYCIIFGSYGDRVFVHTASRYFLSIFTVATYASTHQGERPELPTRYAQGHCDAKWQLPGAFRPCSKSFQGLLKIFWGNFEENNIIYCL